LRAATARPPVTPAAPAPRHRPARSRATLPHATAKLHRGDSRGGTPYALGHASLSLGLWTGSESLPTGGYELITNPTSGVLRGRSPPRGDPPSATPPAAPARLPSLLRAPLHPIPSTFPTHKTPAPAAPRAVERRRFAARPGGTFTTRSTPDCALEGGPSGVHLPSWRYVT
jgi:hypothetical protein